MTDPPLVIALSEILLLVGQASVESHVFAIFGGKEGIFCIIWLLTYLRETVCVEKSLTRLALEMWGSQTGVHMGVWKSW